MQHDLSVRHGAVSGRNADPDTPIRSRPRRLAGAGDLHARGFLFGLTHARDLPTCGRLGSLAAGEVIGNFGARPETSLKERAAKAGLL